MSYKFALAVSGVLIVLAILVGVILLPSPMNSEEVQSTGGTNLASFKFNEETQTWDSADEANESTPVAKPDDTPSVAHPQPAQPQQQNYPALNPYEYAVPSNAGSVIAPYTYAPPPQTSKPWTYEIESPSIQEGYGGLCGDIKGNNAYRCGTR